MRVLKTKWHKYIVATMIMILILVGSLVGLKAEDELLYWNQIDTMDTNFNIVEQKAGDEEVLLELDFVDAGDYTLSYFLVDGTRTDIEFKKMTEQVDIKYYMRDYDGSEEGVNKTSDYMLAAYEEMDYSLAVPDWTFDADRTVGDTSKALEFTIDKSASTEYPGEAFKIDNKRVLIKWDFQLEKMYVLIDNVDPGNILPIEYTMPGSPVDGDGEPIPEKLKVLKQLGGFEIKATHYVPDGADNEDLSRVLLPNDDYSTPGNRPGIEITFETPKEFNTSTWKYDTDMANLSDMTLGFELENIETGDYLDFKLNMDEITSNTLTSSTTGVAGTEYSYTYTDIDGDGENDGRYSINIVQNEDELNHQETFAQWDQLEASSIFDVDAQIGVDSPLNNFEDYEFAAYKPEDKYAYTYMEFELNRSNVEEANLDIQPYNIGDETESEYSILYNKSINADTLKLDLKNDLWLKNYHTYSEDDKEIFIPVPFRSTSTEDFYQVVVEFAGVSIYSQIMEYNAYKDNNVPPTTPTIETVENLFVVPAQDESETDPMKIIFDLEWDAPTNKDIKELDRIFTDDDLPVNPDNNQLFYELSVNEVPTDSDSNPYSVIKVFEVYLEGSEYKLRAHKDSPNLSNPPDSTDTSIPSVGLNYTAGYNSLDELLRMETIALFDKELYTQEIKKGWATVLNTSLDEAAGTYTVTDSLTAYDFKFPGVNYIRLKAIAIKDGDVSISQMSVPASLALSLIAYDVPIVDSLSYEALLGDETSRTSGVTLSWHTVDSTSYEDNMLEPIGYDLSTVTYRVYIAEEKETIVPLDSTENIYSEVVFDETNMAVVVDGTELDTLRLGNGNGIYFDVEMDPVLSKDLDVTVTGLDANEKYYTRIVTVFDVDDKDATTTDLRESGASEVLGLTVPKLPEEPGDSEVFPLAPESFNVTFADDNEISAKLSWIMPGEMTFDDDENGFEIIAIEDRSLPTDLKLKSLTVKEIFDNGMLSDNVVESWRLYKDGGTKYYMKYNRVTDTWEEKSLTLTDPDDTDDAFYVIDDENAPNKVNYYYVRTVKMLGDEVVNASPWMSDTLTTAPINGPKNLIVDYEYDYDYDHKEAFIIRFDAPVPDTATIGVDYIMEVHVKGEDDTDYSITQYPATLVGTDSDGPTGYRRLYYRVDGLKAGKTYSIKVRIEDRTQPQEIVLDGLLEYPKSPFSDRVVSRTEFDQESYDKENKYYEYLEYYVDRAEKLKELPYFEVLGDTNETALKYRENYSEGVIKRLGNGEWTLHSDNKAVNTYYIPSESLESVNDYNVTLLLESKDQVVGIRPNTLGVRLTDEIDDLLVEIAQYTSSYDDYYLRIRLFTDTYNGKINSKTPTSDLVQVEFGIVESKMLEETLDDKMVASLDNVIQANKSELVSKLENELENGIDDLKLLAIVEEMVDEVEQEYMINAAIVFQSQINGETTIIKTIDKSVYIALEPEISPANNVVYSKQNGLWKKFDSAYFNNKYYIETKNTNPFILIPSANESKDLVEVYSQQGVDVINTYDLATIFSSYEFDRPTEIIDKYQWFSVLARVAGANSGEDTAAYLKKKGIDVSTTNSYAPLSYEEALDYYVKTYAYKHKIDLDRVYITNYYSIEDINAVDKAYKTTLIVGANLGIIPLDNGAIDPKHKLTMGETINLLSTLHYGLE